MKNIKLGIIYASINGFIIGIYLLIRNLILNAVNTDGKIYEGINGLYEIVSDINRYYTCEQNLNIVFLILMIALITTTIYGIKHRNMLESK